MTKDTIRQLANVLAAAAALVVNYLAVSLPLNGQDTGMISDRFQVFFVPAGYVFSIWGLIYLGWIAFLVFQLLPSQKESPRLRRLGFWFVLSSLANAAWLFAWHYNVFGLSVVIMLVLLGSLIAAYLRLGVNRVVATRAEFLSVDVVFSVYLGWITVATVANITSWLDLVASDGFGISAQVWAVIMLGVASLLGIAMALTRRDAAYIFVLVWAFIGIAVEQAGAGLVVVSAWVAAALMLAFAIFSLIPHRQEEFPPAS